MHRKPYNTIALGGTFDHFHVGHQHFIDFAASLSRKLIIGVTTTKLTQHKTYPNTIESFQTRKRSVIKYCQKKNYYCEVVELNDVYGPTITDKSINALCVTEETQMGAKQINEMRLKLNWRVIPVHVCNLLKDKSGKHIKSTRIRAGEINREGEIYSSVLDKDITINKEQREFFSKPHGKLVQQPITNKDNAHRTPHNVQLVVGDTSLAQFIKNNWLFDLAIFDGKEKRQPSTIVKIKKEDIDITTKNPAGIITKQLSQDLQNALDNKKKYIFVEGEEDLATVALVFLSPLGTNIYYGQPDEGLVVITVMEQIKNKFFSVLYS